jgi:peptidoglycan/xylan/chitin deacetylase (PgdA/CDA1 family)
VLFALVLVITMVVTQAVVVALRDDTRAQATEAPPTQAPSTQAPPTQASPPQATATQAPPTPATEDQLAATQSKCPAPASEIIRAAPAFREEAGVAARTVALTFDDGPDAATPQVLDVLQRTGVPATFFVVGKQVAANPEMLRRIVAGGHALGDHSWSHDIPSESVGWSRGKLASEIKHTHRAIFDATGLEPCLFRPPGGVVKGATRVTRDARLSMVLWSIDTRDWAPSNDRMKFAAIIRKRAAAGLAEEHPVILLHDGGGDREATVAALPEIINDYRAHGYRFVTLDPPT